MNAIINTETSMILHICCTVQIFHKPLFVFLFFFLLKCKFCAYSVCVMFGGLADDALVTIRLKDLFCIPMVPKKRYCVKYKCLTIKLHLKHLVGLI